MPAEHSQLMQKMMQPKGCRQIDRTNTSSGFEAA